MSSQRAVGWVPATAARSPSSSSVAASPRRSSPSSAAADATVAWGTVASSSAEPCVSARALGATSSGSAASTSSQRETGSHVSGETRMTSSSTPTVHGAAAAFVFHSDHAGTPDAVIVYIYPRRGAPYASAIDMALQPQLEQRELPERAAVEVRAMDIGLGEHVTNDIRA